jgi:putative transposase
MRQDYAVPPFGARHLRVAQTAASPRAQQEPRLEAEVLAADQRTSRVLCPERLQKHLASAEFVSLFTA